MLTDRQCREAKATGKAYKMSDAHSLYLHVSATGYRSWRWKFRFAGKEKLLVIGPYPEISLKQARIAREEAAATLRAGSDPTAPAPQTSSDGPVFETVAKDWHTAHAPLWSAKHARASWRRIEEDVLPPIGQSPVAIIGAADIRKLLLKIQGRGAIETAHKVRGQLEDIFRYAIASEWIDTNPAAGLGKALMPIKKGHRPALIQIAHARELIGKVDAATAHPLTKFASRLLALTATRPGVVQFAQPNEFLDLDGDQPIWHIPAEKMKLHQAEKELEVFDFIVPLSRQAVAVVKAAMKLSGHTGWLFPSRRDARKPMSENALSYLYVRLGYKGRHVPHGWRATFSTIMNERAALLDRHGDRQIIDLMLAHRQEGVEPIYNRAAYMPRRRELAQEWADMLMKDAVAPETLLHLPRR